MSAWLCLSDPYDCIFDSHAVAIITEWDEFKLIDWEKIYDIMKKPAFVFDGRNILNKKQIHIYVHFPLKL